MIRACISFNLLLILLIENYFTFNLMCYFRYRSLINYCCGRKLNCGSVQFIKIYLYKHSGAATVTQ